ncbi:MAG: beta-methylgalactoside transporter [Anaerorhabdus sp.]
MNKLANIDTKRVKKFLMDNAIIVILLLMVVYVSFTRMNFFTIDTFKNISINTSVRFFVALGVSGCLITKGTDLSAGRIVGLGACISATLLQAPNATAKFFPGLGQYPIILMVLLTIFICALIGLINGLIVSYLKVPPFIATLGMQTVVYGTTLVYSKSLPIGFLREDYLSIATGDLFGIPYLVIFALLAGVAMWFLYNKTAHGKYMYAIGGNENAAEVSGINVPFAKIRIYALAAALYGIAGVLLCSKSGGANVNLGLGWELEAIAACTIGGVSTNGGVGKVSGILVGVLVFELLKTSLQFLGVDNSYQFIAQGLVIIVAVALDIRKYTAKK